MISLLKCELKKFRNTYINSLSLLGMLAPVALVAIMFLMKRRDFISAGEYHWDKFNGYLTPFFIYMVGPIITSFIAVFSVFYEYQEKTMKNIVMSPHGRAKIILSKIIHVCIYVVAQYMIVAAVNVVIGLALGFDMPWEKMMDNSWSIILAGLATLSLVPIMMLITLICKNFIPGMILAVCGTISNILVLNWDKSYVSPWAIPADIMGIHSQKNFPMELSYPVTSLFIYIGVFVITALIYFSKTDQNA